MTGRVSAEQANAFRQVQTVATPFRFRITDDPWVFAIIPGRYGQIEWFCDGVDCHSCPLPRQFALAVYSDRPRLFQKLWAIPGVTRHQTGDQEMRAVFPRKPSTRSPRSSRPAVSVPSRPRRPAGGGSNPHPGRLPGARSHV
jgi:hypothetical protein